MDVSDWVIRAIVSGGLILVAVVAAWILVRLVTRRMEDRYERFYARKFIRYGVSAVLVVALVVVWQPFGGQFAAAFGLFAAGVAFAMQEVIGALAGWFNITIGRIFKVGDRIQIAGVQGDVIDITPLRTKLMEIGPGTEATSTWVKGRQHTGRMVAVSNKSTFTDPVFNFSAFFDFIWEELDIEIPHHDDWRRAASILEEEVERISQADEAIEQMRRLRRRFPVPDAEIVPRVFAAFERDVIRLSARFVVPTRGARTAKDELTRRVETRLEEAGIEVVVTEVIQSGPDWVPIGAEEQA